MDNPRSEAAEEKTTILRECSEQEEEEAKSILCLEIQFNGGFFCNFIHTTTLFLQSHLFLFYQTETLSALLASYSWRHWLIPH